MENELVFARSLRNRVATGEDITIEEVQRVAVSFVDCLDKAASSTLAARTAVACSQFVANASVQQTATRDLCWRVLYPAAFARASASSDPDVLDPICYALCNFAKAGIYTLKDGTETVFANLIEFFGAEAQQCTLTSFALLLNQALRMQSGLSPKSTSLLRALSRVDVSCIDSDVLEGVLSILSQSLKAKGSRDVFRALLNCVSSDSASQAALSDLTVWSLRELMAVGRRMRDGYQTDLVALLSNLVGRKTDLVVDMGGLPVILQCIRVDDRNPFIREWALLCVRNMCKDNPRVQDYLRSLELKEVAVDEALGIDVEFDKVTGRFTARRRSGRVGKGQEVRD